MNFKIRGLGREQMCAMIYDMIETYMLDIHEYDMIPIYDRDICCVCWWPRKRVSLGSQEGTPEEGPEPGLFSLGKSFNIPGAQCPKLLCGKTKPSFMEVRMK